MNRSIFLAEVIMISFLLGGCSHVQKEANNLLQYRMIRNNQVFYSTSVFTQSINKGIYKLNYSYSSHQATYYLSSIKRFSDKVVYNQKDTQQLFWVDKRIYMLGEKNFVIHKFIENEDVTDGEISLFWSPTYGIILERANTWRNIKKLIRTGKNTQDDTIAILCDIIFSDVDFYKNRMPDSTIKFVPPAIENDQ